MANSTVPKRAKPKGKPRGGSRAGVPNKATANAREAIARFVDGNSDRLQGWLDDIAQDEKQGPRAAMACFLDMLEYHVPKLARTEHLVENKSASEMTDIEILEEVRRLRGR
jgi:hypothetical protein